MKTKMKQIMVPDFYRKDLELHDVILAVADDLWEGKRR